MLDQGFRTRDPELQLLTIYGAGVSLNEKALYIIQEGFNSSIPQLQLVALNFLSRNHHDSVEEYLNRAMASDSLLIRLEAAFLLSEKKSPKAAGQIESLMYKVDPALIPLFPQLFVLIGTDEAMKIVRKLLINQDEQVRIETIHSLAKHGRDDMLRKIRMLLTHHEINQQEACIYTIGILKDESSVPKLIQLKNSPSPYVRLAALQALYRLGRKETRQEIEKMAKQQDPFAIQALSEMEGSEETLFELTKASGLQVRLNAALALLERQDSRCLVPLCEILVKDHRDLAFVKYSSIGKAFSAWRAIPSAKQNLGDNAIVFELSLHMREEVLRKALDLPEKDFLRLAHTLFELQQNDLIPALVELLENLQTPQAVELLKLHQQKPGAPLIRNYCNLALYNLKESGPYAENLRQWVTKQQDEDLIRFRPFVPWEMREHGSSSYQLTPEDTSQLLIQSLESFVRIRDDKGVDILIETIQNGNPKNRYVLAGLLMRAIL